MSVRLYVPPREAHGDPAGQVGAAVKLDEDVPFGHVVRADFRAEARDFHLRGGAARDRRHLVPDRTAPLFEEDLYEKISPEACIASKISEGSTSFESVKKQLEKIGK